jgi:hypothetical protein
MTRKFTDKVISTTNMLRANGEQVSDSEVIGVMLNGMAETLLFRLISVSVSHS